MLRTTIARLLAITALVVGSLLAGAPPLQAATVPDGVGLAAVAPVTVTATSTGWSHTISGMAAHLCGWSTPALWSAIARVNGIADPDRIGLGQRIVVRCSVNQLTQVPQAQPQRQSQASATWMAPLTGSLCYTPGGAFGAARDGGRRLHKGLDFGRPYGTPIRAIHAGVVYRIRYSYSYIDSTGTRIGAGWYIVINHGGGIYTTSMHNAGRSPLRVGQYVVAGQVIARVGHSGAHANHLHFQVHDGGSGNSSAIDPRPFLRAHGIGVGGC